ncbi:uncharacterized protein LOC123474666 isoform X2 [Daphnia magna]|uniref:uncharacterized protein LOC123466410 isoform X2 n=1 Tax=Daphnia magna TaxID=35525 RepID=UPI001E1BD842|nr:uncharacterized protein LOC123466410 isoform X2 [Daphnia magna]XP_045032993.1 uncharacterized protein LOC123474666 isoform X2 [Daphnia magna]
MAKAKPSSRNCVVFNCINRYSGNDENRESYTLFRVPSNSFNTWQELMPNVKLQKTSRLCNRHFDDSDIVKGYDILGLFHPFTHWRLRAGSNPKYHLEVGIEQPKVRKKALQDVTYATNLPASTLHILANVPITVNQHPLKRSRVSKLLTIERSKVLQLVDLYGVAVNEHGVSQPVTVIPTHQLPTVASSLPPQLLRTASTSFDLLVEYIEPVTPKTVISHFDKQAAEQSQNEGVDQMPNVLQPMAQVAQELERLNNLLLSKQKAKVKAKFKEGKLA